MNDEVQNPMTDYSGCDHQGAAPIAAESVVNSADDHGPHKEHEQTVGNRIRTETFTLLRRLLPLESPILVWRQRKFGLDFFRKGRIAVGMAGAVNAS